MAAQVRDSAPSPRRLIDGQGKIRVRGASSQILFASLLLHLFGLVKALAHGVVERARECGGARHFLRGWIPEQGVVGIPKSDENRTQRESLSNPTQ
jgi:hypothetical protein